MDGSRNSDHSVYTHNVNICVFVMAVVAFIALRRRQKPRCLSWVDEYNQKRDQSGEFVWMYEDLRKDKKRFFIYFRMSTERWD